MFKPKKEPKVEYNTVIQKTLNIQKKKIGYNSDKSYRKLSKVC